MKVAILTLNYGWNNSNFNGGPGIFTWSLHKSLNLAGIENDVYYRIPNVDNYYLDDSCIHVASFPKSLGSDSKSMYYDLLHVVSNHQYLEYLNKNGIAPVAGANIVPNSAPEHCLKYLSQEELILRNRQIIEERRIIKNSVVLFWLHQSMFQRREYERLGLKDLDSCRLIRNGVDINMFKPPKENDGYISWSGKRWWTKGYWILEYIANKLPNEKFVAFSENYLGINAENVKTVIGLPHYKVAEMLKSKIHLNTSCTENQALSILEAMSCGIPVVATNVSGNPEIIEHGKTGFLYDIDNPDEAIEYIRILNEDKKLRRKIGSNARKYIVKNFSFKAMGKLFKDIYEEAISNGV